MNDREIQTLKTLLHSGHGENVLCWHPSPNEIRRIATIGPPPDDDVPEPSECAYLCGGGHIALHNCDLGDFLVATDVRSYIGLMR